MNCEICEQLGTQYQSAVRGLQTANEQFRLAKPNSTESAVIRKAVHICLVELIAAETAKTSHQAWHLEKLYAPAEIKVERSEVKAQ